MWDAFGLLLVLPAPLLRAQLPMSFPELQLHQRLLHQLSIALPGCPGKPVRGPNPWCYFAVLGSANDILGGKCVLYALVLLALLFKTQTVLK